MLDIGSRLSSNWKIQTLGSGDPLLDGVVSLWSPERKKLGLFPQGAFEDYARRGGIHVAIDSDDLVLGYIAVRVSRGWVHIAHLCVAPAARRTTIASRLVEHVAEIAARCQHLGIRLNCRKDYEASDFWPRVGFYPGASKPGKAANSQLILWVRRNQLVDDLFAARQGDVSRRLAVLDANVFYDLSEIDKEWDTLALKVQESLYLAADWVGDAIDLGVVDEMFTEIHRKDCPIENARQWGRAHGYVQVTYQTSEVEAGVQKLGKIFGWEEATRRQKISDMRQIAKAAASDAEFFVTRDQTLLDASEAIAEAMPIRVVSPATLLATLDEEERSHLYVPAKIMGTAIREAVPKHGDLEKHAERFLGRTSREPLHQFRDVTRATLASCSGSNCNAMKLVCDASGDPILLQCLEGGLPDLVTLSLFRTSRHPLAATVARHFLLQAIQKAATTERSKVVVRDMHLSAISEAVLRELDFEKQEGDWVRKLCSDILPVAEADAWLELAVEQGEADEKLFAALERRYWPVKIEGGGIESVTITIKPHWAGKLFDGDLAGQELFGVDPAKVFNRENVFYRSAKAWPKTSPRRILWYVSKTNSFRACSRILNVEVGPASAIFKQYERLGVYEWRDLLGITEQDPHGLVMAVHFADTEVFDTAVSLSEARNFNDARIVVGAHSISEESFLRTYRAGMTRFKSR